MSATAAYRWLGRALDEPQLAALQVIERRADERFREAGFSELLGVGGVTAAAQLREAATKGCLLVAHDPHDEREWVGFALCQTHSSSEVEPNGERWLHLQQISVLPECSSRGIGRELMDRVKQKAARDHYLGVTLRTFRDVPWNAPWYRRQGFEDLSLEERAVEDRRFSREELASGLSPEDRVTLRWKVPAPAAGASCRDDRSAARLSPPTPGGRSS